MGNSDSKKSSPTCNTRRVKKSKSSYFGLSEFSLVNFASNLNSLSFRSGGTQRSTYSATRPWSRVSRHKWRQSTLNNPLEACKTAWPVSRIESAFLPEFKIKKKNEINFEFVGVIAKGAFGRVYKVKKIDNNEFYAMKVLSKAQIISEDAVQQVKDEVRIQSMCGHNPFIVNCPYFWQSHKKIYIVSHYVSGGELLYLCQQYGPLPEELAAIYIAEIALALDFLHNSGVIFRDLKLENVLLDDLGHAQLIDFGLAKWLPYNSRTRTICGTLQYMAPEILSLESTNGYGHAVDWWSLGVLACVLITSKFPPVILRRMAEIAAEAQKESSEKMGAEKLKNCASNITCTNDSQIHYSNVKFQDLSASNEILNITINENCNLLSENENEVSLLTVSDIDNADSKNICFDNGTQFLKSCDNSKSGTEKLNKEENESNNLKLMSDSDARFQPMELVNNPADEVLNIYSESTALHSLDVELSDGARDLIQRLLNHDPQKRLRSLLSLQNIRFFKDINFADIRVKKIAPVDILNRHFPNGPITNKLSNEVTLENFTEFDSDFFMQ